MIYDLYLYLYLYIYVFVPLQNFQVVIHWPQMKKSPIEGSPRSLDGGFLENLPLFEMDDDWG